jgi:hypothetical protein
MTASNAKGSIIRQTRAKTEPPNSENVNADPLYSKIDDGGSDVGYAHVKRPNGDVEEEDMYDPTYNRLNETGDQLLKRDRPFSLGERKVPAGDGVKRTPSDTSAGLYAAIAKDRAASPRSHVHVDGGSDAVPSTSAGSATGIPPNIPSKNFIVSDNLSIPVDEANAAIGASSSQSALNGGIQHHEAVRGIENGMKQFHGLYCFIFFTVFLCSPPPDCVLLLCPRDCVFFPGPKREPSYRYISVREPLQTVQARMQGQQLHQQPNAPHGNDNLESLRRNSGSVHYYSTISEHSYEVVHDDGSNPVYDDVGNATYEEPESLAGIQCGCPIGQRRK